MLQPSRGQSLMTMRVVWAAMFSFAALYLYFIAMMSPVVFNLDAMNPQTTLEKVFSGMALGAFVLSFILPSFIIKMTRRSLNPSIDFQALTRRYFVPLIFRLALLESCSIDGFVMAYLRTPKDLMIMLPFSTLSIIGYLICFPTEAKIRSAFFGPDRI